MTYSWETQRYAVSGQAEHYDRGFRMDTAFLNRVGITRGWQYQAISFYPEKRVPWIKRVNPFLWVQTAKDKAQGGTELWVMPAHAVQLHAPGLPARGRHARARDVCAAALHCRAGVCRRRRAAHQVAQPRRLVQCGAGHLLRPRRAIPGPAARAGRQVRTAAQLEAESQPELPLRALRARDDRREGVRRPHREPAQHVPVQPAVHGAGDHELRQLATPVTRRFPRVLRAGAGNGRVRRLRVALGSSTRACRIRRRRARSSSRRPTSPTSDYAARWSGSTALRRSRWRRAGRRWQDSACRSHRMPRGACRR